jgi:hypothetical protein
MKNFILDQEVIYLFTTTERTCIMAELGDFLVSGDTTVDIDVDMLDYGFIGKCDDAKILRGIIDTLKSGKEGIYPEVSDFFCRCLVLHTNCVNTLHFLFFFFLCGKLCQAAEDRLFVVIPEKERRRIMRLKHQSTPDQVEDAEQDLKRWQTEVFVTDKELRSTETAQTGKRLPPVRGQKVEKLDVPGPKQKASSAGDNSLADTKKTERLSGYDFHAWEKFNVDEA